MDKPHGKLSLAPLLKPNNVAVIGATEKPGSVGRTILTNLITNPFGGTIFPVNPKRPNVLGIKAYSSILDVPDTVDLAIVVTPAPTVPKIIEQCVQAGIPSAVIISAGFKEVGEEGVALEQQIIEAARGKMRIIGPNCLGVMMPRYGLNGTFAGAIAQPGQVAFISQSGAICTAVLDWSFDENVGFSAFISIGSMLDVGWGDLIYYLGDDPHTRSIVIYMESVGDARAFMSAAKEVSRTKPIIVIKAGRTEAAAKAAASHTGSLTGSDEVLDTAFRRAGVLRVDRISDVFNLAEVLSKQPRPRGNNLTIVTNAGGPGVLATDALIRGGGQLTKISEGTMEELNEFLPFAWSHNNPIDILGDAAPERYAKSLEIAANDPNSDGMLVILTPQDMTDPTQTAEYLRPYANISGKPVLASWMGGPEISRGEQILNRANIPTFEYPDTAVRMFNYMWQYTYNLDALYETPVLPSDEEFQPDRTTVNRIIETAKSSGRTILTEDESKQVLAAYGVHTIPNRVATTPDAAVQAADEIGYPVVIKIHSETITHKTDVGGVMLNLRNADNVREAFAQIQGSVGEKVGAEHFHGVAVQPMIRLDDAYELIMGSSVDPQFGPVILFGMGGSLVEVFKDRALGLPPLTTTLARRMMECTKIYEALHGVRGRRPIDMEELEKLLVRFSQIAAEQPWIAEMDINPLLASPDRLLALDARVVLHPPNTAEADLSRTAIRPYPTQYVWQQNTRNGTEITIRPIRPEDEPLMVKFHETLSERTVHMRYFSPLKLQQRVAHERLSRICFIDYDYEMVLVATRRHPKTDETQILGAGRLTKSKWENEGEFGLLVGDEFQGYGLGTMLLERVIEVGKQEGLDRIMGHILADNSLMLNLMESRHFTTQREEGNIIAAVLNL